MLWGEVFQAEVTAHAKVLRCTVSSMLEELQGDQSRGKDGPEAGAGATLDHSEYDTRVPSGHLKLGPSEELAAGESVLLCAAT